MKIDIMIMCFAVPEWDPKGRIIFSDERQTSHRREAFCEGFFFSLSEESDPRNVYVLVVDCKMLGDDGSLVGFRISCKSSL